MPPPVGLSFYYLNDYSNVEAAGTPWALTFGADGDYGPPSLYHTPEAGDVILVFDSTQQIFSTPGYTLLGEVTDVHQTYRAYYKVSDGTETGISGPGHSSGIYARIMALAMRPHPRDVGSPADALQPTTAVVHGVAVDPITTPDLTPIRTCTARIDMATGQHAVSDYPRPTDYDGANVNGWHELWSTGNTASGPSTTGWFCRYVGDGIAAGEEWYNPSNTCQASLSWLIDIASGGWEINKVGMT